MRKIYFIGVIILFLSLFGVDIKQYFDFSKLENLLDQGTLLESGDEATLYFYLKLYDVKFPRIVVAQAIQETGHFKSTIYRENNNYFGMKCDPSCFCGGTQRGHAKYSSLIKSIKSYKCWQNKRFKENLEPTTEQEYLDFLNHYKIKGNYYRYAEDPNYTDKLQLILKKFKF